ncbi:potassium channel family protein [Pseudomonas sp. S1_E04]
MKKDFSADKKSRRSMGLINFFAGQKPHTYGALYFVNIILFGFLYWLTPGSFKCALSLGVSMYFSVVTATTLGYGDITPNLGNPFMPMLVSVQVLVGIALVGLFLNALSHRLSEQKDKATQDLESAKKEEQISRALVMLRPVVEQGLRTLAQLYKFTAPAEKLEYKIRPKDFLTDDYARQVNAMVYYNLHEYVNGSVPMYSYFIEENKKFSSQLDKYLDTFAHSLPVTILVLLTDLGRHRFLNVPNMHRNIHHIVKIQSPGSIYPDNFPAPSDGFSQGEYENIINFNILFLELIYEMDRRNPESPVMMTISLRDNIYPRVGAGLHPTPY